MGGLGWNPIEACTLSVSQNSTDEMGMEFHGLFL